MARDDLARVLETYGAVRGQLVELEAFRAQTLRYADLLRSPSDQRPAFVLESQGQPRAYVFDDRKESATRTDLVQWVRRISFRGDADFLTVVRPGRLDVYRAALDGTDEPQQLRDLPQGPMRLPALLNAPPDGTGGAVRKALRNLLRDSILSAKKLGAAAKVDAHDALSLTGRALFWRFLIDRGLLTGISPADICDDPRATKHAACMDSKGRSLKTFEWLDRTFNGGLLAFRYDERAAEIPHEVYEGVVGNIAHAATSTGQLQLPTEWRDVNFAHVPVGLLSEVYEAYTHDEDPNRAETESIYYTPRHLAEFVVDEALASLKGVAQPKILDPAVGAGVFLVTIFRALVARECDMPDQQLSRGIIRRVLNEQLTGFDINDAALRLAELALYLTAIELDPDPSPRPLSLLKFEKPLHGKVLLLRAGGAARGSLVAVDERFRGKFDLVIGNPPWTAKDKLLVDKECWEESTRHVVRQRLGTQRAREFCFLDTNPDLPFVYRAMEWAKPLGTIALFTHARWLFPGEDRDKARRDLFESVYVTGIVNGTGVRDTSVWPGNRAPFAILFARNEVPPAEGASIQFVSPHVEIEPQLRQERMRFDWSSADPIDLRQALKTPWLLKQRFRGTPFDENIVRQLTTNRSTLLAYIHNLRADLKNGYIVGNQAHAAEWLQEFPCITPARSLEGKRATPPSFHIEPTTLQPCGERRVEARRSQDIYRGPLLLIRQSPPADFTAPRSAVSDTDVAYSQSWHGASFAGVPEGVEHARYLQLVLQSNAFPYFLLLTDGGFGVERERFVLENLKSFPVIPLGELSGHQRRSMMKLSNKLWSDGWTKALGKDIDNLVFDLYGLDDVDRQSVADTLATALPYAEQRKNAVRAPSPRDVNLFVAALEEELENVIGSSGRRARVMHRVDVSDGPWEILCIEINGRCAAQSPDAPIPWKDILVAADASGATIVMVHDNPRVRFVAILKQYRYWTTTRARVLALSLLSGMAA